MYKKNYLRKTPPNKDAFKHSGGDSLRCTSATVTLYFDVLDNKLRRPGTEQNTSLGEPIFILPLSFVFMSKINQNKKISIQAHLNCTYIFFKIRWLIPIWVIIIIS